MVSDKRWFEPACLASRKVASEPSSPRLGASVLNGRDGAVASERQKRESRSAHNTALW